MSAGWGVPWARGGRRADDAHQCSSPALLKPLEEAQLLRRVAHQQILELLAEYGDSELSPIPVAIETGRGLLVAFLRQGKRQVYALNPMSVARYRDRHSVSRKKSDPGDALVLANILRTDADMHRPLPNDSELAQSVAVLARAQQDATWNRQQLTNQLRSLLRDYYPAALEAVAGWQNGLCRPEARAVLAVAPTPGKAATINRKRLCTALKRAGRVRGIEAEAERWLEILQRPQARHPKLVEDALGRQMLGLLRQLDAACRTVDELAAATEKAFREHPDSEVMLSFPGLGVQLGARILAEIGDDRSRFDDARGLKSYAGAAPITRASGKHHYVGRRRIKNNRLHDAGFLWAFSALTASGGANAHYRRRRARGDFHPAALRHLFNRMLGQLFHCLQTRTLFDEKAAFSMPLLAAA
ncbi:IS110 family transposase [Streptomyces sp. AV19]|uniref:IS110 family transposase n=1 Tax=Streptomyces sp. AV19 TaxID=2793068 RepID=UPI0035ABD745